MQGTFSSHYGRYLISRLQLWSGTAVNRVVKCQMHHFLPFGGICNALCFSDMLSGAANWYVFWLQMIQKVPLCLPSLTTQAAHLRWEMSFLLVVFELHTHAPGSFSVPLTVRGALPLSSPEISHRSPQWFNYDVAEFVSGLTIVSFIGTISDQVVVYEQWTSAHCKHFSYQSLWNCTF